MAVIGMAVGGLSLGIQVLGGQQAAIGGTVRQVQDARAAEMWLARRLSENAPFRAHAPEDLSGSATGFTFACAASGRCGMTIAEAGGRSRLSVVDGAGAPMTFRLPAADPTRFVYRGATASVGAWPPAGGAREALRSVALVQGDGPAARVVFETRLRVEQPLDCQFDAIMQDCR